MATLQIRDLPDEDAEVFRRRAAAAGMSLQAYMRRELITLARRPTKSEALAAIRESLERDPGPGADGDSILEALRELRGD
ncbi:MULTISPECIES: antitoxin [unclassified Nocardia]|uniref:FitA-like ribbon-helix-helix domain-containing protein n=1 Tax=unclassified Nocardia TaxID=2637762 RepID=UPI0024A950D8|nr:MULTISPECIES: antitoxin [unclassified Nocardia]